MPRSRSFTADDVAAAALAVITRDGLAAMSMRTVASELGTGAMTLYRYVDSREALERLVVERVMQDLDLAVSPALPWRERVAVLLGRARAVLAAHPELIPLVIVHRGNADGLHRVGEAVLGALAEAGLDGYARAIAFRALMAFVIGHVLGQRHGPLSGRGTTRMSELGPAAFPVLAETAAHALSIPPEDEFRLGLDLVLRGIEAR